MTGCHGGSKCGAGGTWLMGWFGLGAGTGTGTGAGTGTGTADGKTDVGLRA